VKIIVTIFLTGSICQYAASQSTSTLIGARSNGMAYASSCVGDAWSLFNNVGGMAKTEHLTTAFTLDAQPAFKPFNRSAAVVAIPFSFGVSGIGAYRFGDDLYNEQLLTVGFSNQFGLASLGLKVNYVQYNVVGYGRKDAVSISFGGIAQLSPKLSFGAHITNINQPVLSKDDQDEKLPTILNAGVAFKPTDKVFITTELQKDLSFEALWKTGIEYKIHKKFFLRTGIHVNPNAGFFGFAFHTKKLLVDYAYSHFSNLGAKHQASIGFSLNKENK
jgi:hypothetical protein